LLAKLERAQKKEDKMPNFLDLRANNVVEEAEKGDLMTSFSPIWAVASFLGGWCGTVPISVLIWYLIHHKQPPPPPPPDPWWRISIVGAIVGCIVGTLVVSFTAEAVTSSSIIASALVGYAAGSIAGGIVGRLSLPR
jgi:hypothetical protein